MNDMTGLNESWDFDEQWESLTTEAPEDGAWRSLHTPFTFRVVHHLPDRVPSLLIAVEDGYKLSRDDLISPKQISVSSETRDGRTWVSLQLLDRHRLDLFLQICRDIVPRVQNTSSARAGADQLLSRFRAWRQFLQATGGNGLDRKHQLGLYGEIQTLIWLIEAGTNPLEACRAWTGPDRSEQDFQIHGLAIEVKSIVQNEPQRLYIDGARQLDESQFDALVIAHHHVHRQKGAGETLPMAVERAREAVHSDLTALEVLDNKLLAYGYLETDRRLYEDDGYGITGTSNYRVQPGFPRLTEGDLPLGVGGLRYVVEASACAPFEIEDEQLKGWIADPASITVQSGHTHDQESAQTEYKATAWNPVGPEHANLPEEARKEASRNPVNHSIVKTVAAFLNSGGGELVIGMADDLTVTGIEPDLEWLDADLDLYQLRLVQLLRENIDELVTNYLSIDFREHDNGTTCHVGVRASPQPRHARKVVGKKGSKERVFYNRSINSTHQVSTEKIPEFLSDRFGLGPH